MKDLAEECYFDKTFFFTDVKFTPIRPPSPRVNWFVEALRLRNKVSKLFFLPRNKKRHVINVSVSKWWAVVSFMLIGCVNDVKSYCRFLSVYLRGKPARREDYVKTLDRFGFFDIISKVNVGVNKCRYNLILIVSMILND